MMKNQNNQRQALHLMIGQTKSFVIFSLCTVAIVILGIVSVAIIKSFIDQVIVDELHTKISAHVIPFVLTFCVATLFIFIGTNAKAKIVSNVSTSLVKTAYNSILISDYNEAKHAENKALVDRVVKNSQIIGDFYLGKNILPFIEVVTALVSILIATFFVQPLVGLIMLLLTPFYCMAVKGIEMFMQKIENNYNQSLVDNQKKISDSYDKLKNIKLLNGSTQEKEELNDLANEYSETFAMKTFALILSKSILIVVFSGVLIAASLGIGGALYPSSQNISAGTFLFVAMLSPVFFVTLYRSLHFTILSNEVDIAEMELARVSTIRSENRSEPVTNLDEIHTVKFKDIICLDTNNKKIVDGINFEVKRGEKIGIFSVDKDTKQAMFECLTKLSRPKEGQISINNCDLAKINSIYLRTIITSIFEDSCVFDKSTLLENVCYPETFDEYKYNDALYRSGLKNIISKFQDKENTLVENSINDSEVISTLDDTTSDFMKRLVFANAFYKDSKIFILCDATLGLSPTIESEILSEIFKLKNKIVIMLTDKAYLLSKCDKILIVENGKTLEYGKYVELISNKESTFYKMIKRAPSRKAKIS